MTKLTSEEFTRDKIEYKVVVLPEPVGPETNTIPFGCEIACSSTAKSRAEKPRVSNFTNVFDLSKRRITTRSPYTTGKIDTRISISFPAALISIRPS